MTSKEVLRSLVGLGTNCLWSPTRLLALPNAMDLAGWEGDLLLLHPSGWLWEVEIKVSVGDFRREFKTKAKKHKALEFGSSGYCVNRHVLKYFFAMPKEVFERLRPEEIPAYAGVIVLDPEVVDSWGRMVPKIVRRAPQLPGVSKTGPQFRAKFLELCHVRFWTLTHNPNLGELALETE